MKRELYRRINSAGRWSKNRQPDEERLMKVLTTSAAILLALAGTGAQAAPRDCSVTHHQCYPACIQMNADGSDCAKTREVCRDICGPKPSYPSVSNTERIDAMRFEATESRRAHRPMDEQVPAGDIPDAIEPSPYPE
jgi:hypothetical protein